MEPLTYFFYVKAVVLTDLETSISAPMIMKIYIEKSILFFRISTTEYLITRDLSDTFKRQYEQGLRESSYRESVEKTDLQIINPLTLFSHIIMLF